MFFVDCTKNLFKKTSLLRMCVGKNIAGPLIVTEVLLPLRKSLAQSC
jgi:hypothetical protein